MQTQSSQVFSGQSITDSIKNTILNWASAKLLDHSTSPANIPDQVDVATGQATNQTGLAAAPAGIPMVGWLLIGGGIIAGVLMLRHG